MVMLMILKIMIGLMKDTIDCGDITTIFIKPLTWSHTSIESIALESLNHRHTRATYSGIGHDEDDKSGDDDNA